jgi:hypothetical protein
VLGVRGLRWPAVGEGRGKRNGRDLSEREESVVFNLGRERRESRVSNLKKFHANGVFGVTVKKIIINKAFFLI